MGRLFEEHIIRTSKSLDGAWKFRADMQNVGESEKWYNGIPDSATVIVPSVWGMQDDLLFYDGAAWYEKKFHTDGGCLRFCFGAVMTEAKIWLDGIYLGSHYGGFCQFDFIVPDVSKGFHRLTVRSDNSFDEHSIPQHYVDWHHHGGIPRSVTVEKLQGTCILSCRFDYNLTNDYENALCTVTLELYNAGEEKASHIRATLGDLVFYSDTVNVKSGCREVVTLPEFTIENPRLWDIFKPELYTLSIETETDDLIDRIGFRHISVGKDTVLLNGKKVEFRGVNRHEEHPDFGFAFPPELIKKDVDLILEMGCNAIRGSHYPNSKEFVDYLDMHGILFWSEIPIWGGGFSEETLADPIVIERGLDMHREMLKHYYNHPCIVMWGMHNEILTNTKPGLDISNCYYNYLKKNGGNRLVVYATNIPMDDICFEYCDVMCLNVYTGWYGKEMDSWADFVNEFVAKRDNEPNSKGKPIIFSEFGGAALYGFHDNSDALWSEEYQAKLISHCLKVFHEHPSVVGSFIWQLCDTRTLRRIELNRARGFNNKGLLNEYRKPKMSYYAAQKLYKEFSENDE